MKYIKKTVNIIRENKLKFIAIAVIDALFFIAYGFFTQPIQQKLTEYAILISNQISKLLAERPKGIMIYLFEETVKNYTYKLILLLMILFLTTYLVYAIFQGTSWWLAGKQKYRKYFLNFAKINLLWAGIYALYKITDLFIGLRQVVIQKINPGAINISGIILNSIFVFIIMLAFISYPNNKIKQFFTTPLKKTIPLILFSIILYGIAISLIKIISKFIPTTASLLIALAILFPIIAFIKIHATNVITNDTQH